MNHEIFNRLTRRRFLVKALELVDAQVASLHRIMSDCALSDDYYYTYGAHKRHQAIMDKLQGKRHCLLRLIRN